MWRGVDIAQLVVDEFVREDRALRAEQAVRGLDSRSELELHSSIANALAAANLGVLREVPFPSLSAKQRKKVDQMRCDLVITEHPGQTIRDALRERIDTQLRMESLFGQTPPPAPDGLDPRDCLWLEVKTVGQFTYTSGVPGPNRTYTSELIGSIRRDIAKLSADPRIEKGELLLVLFTATPEVAEHDLSVAANRVLDRGTRLGGMRWRHAPIQDLAGNAFVTGAIFEIARPD